MYQTLKKAFIHSNSNHKPNPLFILNWCDIFSAYVAFVMIIRILIKIIVRTKTFESHFFEFSHFFESRTKKLTFLGVLFANYTINGVFIWIWCLCNMKISRHFQSFGSKIKLRFELQNQLWRQWIQKTMWNLDEIIFHVIWYDLRWWWYLKWISQNILVVCLPNEFIPLYCGCTKYQIYR